MRARGESVLSVLGVVSGDQGGQHGHVRGSV